MYSTSPPYAATGQQASLPQQQPYGRSEGVGYGVSRQAPSGPSLPGTRAPTRAEMLYASYKKPATVDEKEDLPRSPSAASSTTSPESDTTDPPTTSPIESTPPEPQQSKAKARSNRLSQRPDAYSSAQPILPAKITFDHSDNAPRRSSEPVPAASLYSSRVAPPPISGPRPLTSSGSGGGQPSLHRGQSYSGPPDPASHHHRYRSATESLPPRAEARSIHSVASPASNSTGMNAATYTPQISRHSSASVSAAYPPYSTTSPQSPPPLPPSITPATSQASYQYSSQTSPLQYSSPPMSPPPQTPANGVPVQGMYQPVSPPLQVPVVTQPPATGPRSSTLLQETGKAAAATVGSTLGRIALRVALGSVGDVIGDAIGSVASEAISSIGADAATSALTDSGVVGGLAAGLTAGAGFMDPSSFLTAGMLGGDMTSAFSGDAMSGLTDSFAGLSTADPAAYGGYSTDAFQNYQTIMESIQANQPSYADTYSQILQAQQAQQNAAQSQFESIYQSQLQSQQDLMQQIMQQAQTTQAEAYKTQMEMYQNILEQSQSTSQPQYQQNQSPSQYQSPSQHQSPSQYQYQPQPQQSNHAQQSYQNPYANPYQTQSQSTPNVAQHPQAHGRPPAHHSATSPYPSSYRPPQMVHPPGRR